MLAPNAICEKKRQVSQEEPQFILSAHIILATYRLGISREINGLKDVSKLGIQNRHRTRSAICHGNRWEAGINLVILCPGLTHLVAFLSEDDRRGKEEERNGSGNKLHLCFWWLVDCVMTVESQGCIYRRAIEKDPLAILNLGISIF